MQTKKETNKKQYTYVHSIYLRMSMYCTQKTDLRKQNTRRVATGGHGGGGV